VAIFASLIRKKLAGRVSRLLRFLKRLRTPQQTLDAMADLEAEQTELVQKRDKTSANLQGQLVN